MAAPLNQYAFDPEIMKRAAENYRRRTAEREHKQKMVEAGRYDEVDGKTRMTKRVNRLISHLRETAAEALPAAGQGGVVLDYCAAVRGILNDDQGGPLQPPGLRMAAALAEVRESLQRNLDAKKGGMRSSN